MSDFNFKDFKKSKSDKDSTTLVHKGGHTLVVAHAGLTPKVREQLMKLPAQVQKFADGSPTGVSEQSADDESDNTPKDKPQSPVTINIGQQGPGVADNSRGPQPQPGAPQGPQAAQAPLPTPAQYVPGVSDPGPQATTGFNPNAPQAPAPAAPAAPAASAAGTQETPGDEGAPYTGPQAGPKQAQGAVEVPPQDPAAFVKQSVQQKFTTEDKAWQQDLANGHVTPETYHDLFAKKETLGKIGTIFGLILGGAGSGLTHQPNAALQMMNQQINNDLEAQKASKTNAFNFLNLNRERIMNNAQIDQMERQGNLTNAQATAARTDAAAKAQALSRMQANRAVVHKLTMDVQKLPVGTPQRQQAEQTLAMMNSAVDAENYSISDKAATQSAFLTQMGVNMAGEPQNGGGNQLSAVSSQLRKAQALGYVNKDQYDKGNEELKMIQNKQQANQGALDSFDKVANMVTLGNRVENPIQSSKQINAEWDPMLDKLTKSNEGRVTPITVEMMNAIKPAMGDDDKTKQIKRQKLSEILNSGYSTPVLDGLRMTPSKASPAAAQQAPQTMMSKSGRPMIQVNGKWHYKQ